MAREITIIKDEITANFMANSTVQIVYGLTAGYTFYQEFSKVSLENILFDVITYGIWTLEKIFDVFRAETEQKIAENKVHSKEWYRQKALGFMFGFPVVTGTDKFITTGSTPDLIENSKVIKQAACVKLISSNGYGILRIKVATANGAGELIQVPLAQFNALKQYMLRHVVDAGTQIKITTGGGDDLKLKIDIYYDPLVLSTTGTRLDGTSNTPVLDSIKDFLKSIEFNGSLIVSDLQKSLRLIEGVKVCKIKEAYSKYGTYDYTSTGIQNIGLIDEIRIADSGYMKLDEGVLEINYKLFEE